MLPCHFGLLTLLVLPLAVAWETLTVYDVLPSECGAVDAHSFSLKDYGDSAGDAYYAMRSLLPPMLCDRCHSEAPTPDALCVRYNGIAVGTCFSEQAHPGPQVARKITVEIPEQHDFGPYGACNPAENATGTDICEYECVPAGEVRAVAAGIGRQRLTEEYICTEEIGQRIANETNQTDPAIRALHYDYNLCRLLDGHWYSVGNDSFAGTLWRAPTLVKAIDSQCLMSTLHQRVRNASGTACFDSCPDGTINGHYNTSSPCYVRCFYDTLLGPNADSTDYAGGGMGAAAINDAWLAGFDVCPEYDFDAEREAARVAEEQRLQERRDRLNLAGVLLPGI